MGHYSLLLFSLVMLTTAQQSKQGVGNNCEITMEIPMFCFVLIFYLNSIGMWEMFSTRIFYTESLRMF